MMQTAVHTREVVGTTLRGDLSGPEQPFQNRLACVPVPPTAFGTLPRAHVTGDEPLRRLVHSRQKFIHHSWMLLHCLTHTRPHTYTLSCHVHAQTTEREVLQWQM